MGISDEKNEKLFQFKYDNRTLGTNNEKGTGLGLILSKDFVEKHQGKLWVESVLGEGSNFIFTIPIKN